jgi:AraC-like DNA-binding protein
MGGRAKTVGAGSRERKGLWLNKEAVTAPVAASTGSTRGGLLVERQYLELIRKHLGHAWDRLFADFTGLHFHIAWKMPFPREWAVQSLPSGTSVCCRWSGSPQLAQCRACRSQNLAVTLASDRGHGFTCRLGVRNFWAPIRVRSETVGVAYLQALAHLPRKRPGKPDLTHAAHARLSRRGAVVLSHLKFNQATRFLQQIVQHVQTASLSDLRKADLTNAARCVVALEREQARLRGALQRHLPAAPAVGRSSGPESHAEQVVHGLLERLQLDYAKPITLRGLARELGMNTAYLSALFSRRVGIPFKSHLTEIRLHKARELLADIGKTASEVALATGYSSEERFRRAFKKATGLSPKAWRETMQSRPLA